MTLSKSRSSLQIETLLSNSRTHVHFAGVCGVGMAGLAFLLKARRFNVSGCDLIAGRMSGWLQKRGIKFIQGHDPGHISKSVNWVIRSAAVPQDNPEIVRALKMGIPVVSRGMVLPELIRSFTSVAVGGTHGKTTTATFIAQLLKHAGRQPSWCIGGEAVELGGVAGFRGKSGFCKTGKFRERDTIVVEADESDGTLALYAPDIAVVTNIEFDHMEHFENVKAFEECFRSFAGAARRKTIYCADDKRAGTICSRLTNCISYGLNRTAGIKGTDIVQHVDKSEFTIFRYGRKLGRIMLPVPGVHNILNALAAAAAGFELGLTFEEIRRGLGNVSLPRRRFERIVERKNITVISDYAHHPSEIRALVRTAVKLGHSRIVAVFQPHRYTRTLALGPAFPGAFEGVDELVLVPVYEASEKPLKGGSIWDLYGHFRRRNISRAGMKVSVATSLEQAWQYFRITLGKGDLFLVIGAGDVEKIAGWAGNEIDDCRLMNGDLQKFYREIGFPSNRLGRETTVRFHEPMAVKTTMGVGGTSDVFVNTASLKNLRLIIGWTRRRKMPLTLLGGGSNVVISDLGIRGVTVRMVGGDFGEIGREGNIVTAGCGVPVSKLLGFLQGHSLSGLEFLEGIPGTVGGALRMNAGAWGCETGGSVTWIQCLNKDGSECTLTGKAAGFAYRECRALRDRILIKAGFRVISGSMENIRKRRKEIRECRAWMRGIRSAGSVFRNPENNFAGKLIEQCGLKGVRIGGAAVSRKHANVIIARPGACASDVLALINKLRGEVLERTGICLETEVKCLE